MSLMPGGRAVESETTQTAEARWTNCRSAEFRRGRADGAYGQRWCEGGKSAGCRDACARPIRPWGRPMQNGAALGPGGYCSMGPA